MTKPKTLVDKKIAKLRTLTDTAIVTIRSRRVGAFTKGWLGQVLSTDPSAASQVISQLKKDNFLEHETTNWGDFQDPRNRGKYFFVREAPQGWIGGSDGWKAFNGKGRYDDKS